jgi:hypothetical protein
MKTMVSVVIYMLLTTCALAGPGKQQCHDAAKAFVVPLLQGRYENLGPAALEPEEGWDAWLASQFPAPGNFTAYMIHEPVVDRGICRINLRLKKPGGMTYALFAEFDRNLQLIGLASLKDKVEEHREELIATLEEIKEILPDLKAGIIDDADVLPLLKRLTITTRESRSDTIESVLTLRDPTPK